MSERIHISTKTVAKVVQKFKNSGMLRPNLRSGRLSLLKREARHVQQCVTKDRRRSASSLA